jgi:putative flippase GtrA
VKLIENKSATQFGRYLFVGAFNTVFGYCLFALLNWSFQNLGSFAYMYAWLLTSGISITVAFLAYKWFVFRTRGNYLIEWIRCFSVYSGALLFGAVALPIAVTILRRTLHRPDLAPYIAVAILTTFTVIFSFLGHKNFSFKR